MQYLIRIDPGRGVTPHYELREGEDARDACIAQYAAHADWRVSWGAIESGRSPADGSPLVLSITLVEVGTPRDPGRGA